MPRARGGDRDGTVSGASGSLPNPNTNLNPNPVWSRQRELLMHLLPWYTAAAAAAQAQPGNSALPAHPRPQQHATGGTCSSADLHALYPVATLLAGDVFQQSERAGILRTTRGFYLRFIQLKSFCLCHSISRLFHQLQSNVTKLGYNVKVVVNNRVTVTHEEPSEYQRRYKRPFILQMFVICSLGAGVSVSIIRPAASPSPLQLKQNIHYS